MVSQKNSAIQNANPNITWRSIGMSDVGNMRSENQDAFLLLPERRLWVVADGMGGHAAGDLASQRIVESLRSVSPAVRLKQLAKDVQERLQLVNRWLRAKARERQVGIIGSTVAALLSLGRHCVCIWAGDSRVYRYRAGQLRQLTRDHRLVEEIAPRHVIDCGQAENHSQPWAYQLTRAVGASDRLELAAEIREVLPGDKYLLCSDGLYEEVSNSEIINLIDLADMREACIALVELANKKGGHDNITVILLRAEKLR
jgi:protein phosphatase